MGRTGCAGPVAVSAVTTNTVDTGARGAPRSEIANAALIASVSAPAVETDASGSPAARAVLAQGVVEVGTIIGIVANAVPVGIGPLVGVVGEGVVLVGNTIAIVIIVNIVIICRDDRISDHGVGGL